MNKTPEETRIQELTRTINKLDEKKKTQGEKISRLLIAHKKWKNRELGYAPVKEPVLLFERRNGNTEIHEGIGSGMMEFKHSSGQKRFIIIDPNTIGTMGAGRDTIRIYKGHEDHPITGWPNPLVTTEQVNIIIEKTLNDQQKWKAKDKEALGNMWLKIGLGIGAIVLAVAMYKLLVPTPQTVQVIYETAKETTKNATNYIGQINLTN